MIAPRQALAAARQYEGTPTGIAANGRGYVVSSHIWVDGGTGETEGLSPAAYARLLPTLQPIPLPT